MSRVRAALVLLLLARGARGEAPLQTEPVVWLPTGPRVAVADVVRDRSDRDRAWAATESGVLASIDAGQTWAPVVPDCPGRPVKSLAVDSSSALYAATESGLFRLERSAWTKLAPDPALPPGSPRVNWIAVDPSDAANLLLGALSAYVHRSTDRGATWRIVLSGGLGNIDSVRASFDPFAPTVLIPIRRGVTSVVGDVARSTDRGETWGRIADEHLPLLDETVFDPVRQGVAYAATSEYSMGQRSLLQSSDAGATWPRWIATRDDFASAIAVTETGDLLATGRRHVYRFRGGATEVSIVGGDYPVGVAPTALAALDPEGVQLVMASDRGLFRTVGLSASPPVTELLPVVVDAFGANGARFTTALTLFNASDAAAEATLTYTASTAAGSEGSGSFTVPLHAREQRILEDATAFLRASGLPIPPAREERAQIGSLRITARRGDPSGRVVASAVVRTPSTNGRAGTSFSSIGLDRLATHRLVLGGLPLRAGERRNLAVVNAGASGSVTLSACLVGAGPRRCLSAELGPGQWLQWPSAALGDDWHAVEVERLAGDERWTAYGTIVDNFTNDGSFVGPVPDRAATVPAVVEASGFTTELSLWNPADWSRTTFFLDYLESLSTGVVRTFRLQTTLPARESLRLSETVEAFRASGAPVGPRGPAYAGLVSVPTHLSSVWARTTIGTPSGGRYGVAYPALAEDDLADNEAWIPGLLPDESSRTNVAFLNPSTWSVTLDWALLPGQGGVQDQIASGRIWLPPGGWQQIPLRPEPARTNAVLRVRKTHSDGLFAAYAVVNDGVRPGERTDDGTYLPMVPVR